MTKDKLVMPAVPPSPPPPRRHRPRVLFLALLAASSPLCLLADDAAEGEGEGEGEGGGNGGDDGAPYPSASGGNGLALPDLQSLASHLRADDFRLVHYSSTELTSERQSEEDGVCGGKYLPAVLDALRDGENRDLESRTVAAEILALCATDHPENRERIGRWRTAEKRDDGDGGGDGGNNSGGIHGAIVELIDEVGLFWAADEPLPDVEKEEKKQKDDKPYKRPWGDQRKTVMKEDEEKEGEGGEEEKLDPGHVYAENPAPPAPSNAAAAAAELTYALSFNSKTNVDALVEAGIVEALARVVVRCQPRSNFAGYRMCTPHVRMWSMAALQNLAASYCDNEADGGRCSWVWTGGETLEVDVEESGKVTVDGTAVRDRMYDFDGLIEALVHESCLGSVRTKEGRPNRDVPWPGEDAQRGWDETKASIVPWSAAAAIKNLALHDEAREDTKAAALCLCALSASPDWLEIDKGESALYHMGMDDHCHYWTEEEELEEPNEEEEEDIEILAGGYCVDYDWFYEDEDGDVVSCLNFEDEEVCEQAGENVDDEGVTANEACCACGGGDRVEELVREWQEDEL